MTKIEYVLWPVGFLLLIGFFISLVILGVAVLYFILQLIIAPSYPYVIDILTSLFEFIQACILILLRWIITAFRFISSWICLMHNYKPPGDLLVIISGVLATFIGISLPISIGVVGEHLAPYKDPDISKLFKQEREFIVLAYSIILFPFIFILYFLNINYSFLTITLLGICIYIFYTFYKFIHKVFDYIIKTDEIILEKQRKIIEKVVK